MGTGPVCDKVMCMVWVPEQRRDIDPKFCTLVYMYFGTDMSIGSCITCTNTIKSTWSIVRQYHTWDWRTLDFEFFVLE